MDHLLLTLIATIFIGQTIYLSFVLRRVRRDKKELSQSSRRYRDLVEKTNVGHALFDMNFDVLYANTHYAEMAGISQDKIIGRNVKAWVHPSYNSTHTEMVTEFKKEGVVENFEMAYLREDHTKIDVALNAFLSDGDSGKVIIVHCRDITDRKNYEREMALANNELITRNKELDSFTYIASHDLQEPAKKLMALCSLLRYDTKEYMPDKSKSDIDCIVKTAARMQDLIRDLLDLSRIGRDDIKKESVRIEDCVDSALSGLSMMVLGTNAKVVKDEFVSVCGNKGLITQLYHNLISNSLKFTSPDISPEIHLTCTRADDGATVFGVKDNGIGIPDKYKDEIFQTFNRLYSRDKYEGNGIGLSICKKIIERHGGRLWIDKDFEYGSYFKFTLPLCEDEKCG